MQRQGTIQRVHLGARREVRLPQEATRRLKLKKGAALEVVVSGDVLLLVPAGSIPKSQRYFWTPAWQAMEREADDDLAAGRVQGPFDTAAAAIAALRRKPA